MGKSGKAAFAALLFVLSVGELFSLSVFPAAFTAFVFNDTGESITELESHFLPGVITSGIFAVCIALTIWSVVRCTALRVATAIAAVVVLAAYLAAVPLAREGFAFDIALYQQSACSRESIDFLCTVDVNLK